MKNGLQIISALFLSSFVLMGCNTGQDNNDNDNNAPDVEENNQDNNGNNQDTNDNNVPGVDEDDTINKDDEKIMILTLKIQLRILKIPIKIEKTSKETAQIFFEEKPALSLEGGFYHLHVLKKAGIEPAFYCFTL